MNMQVMSTLSVPRLIRPLSDSYSDFRADFEGELRNITLLSRNLTYKVDGLRIRLVPLGALPSLPSAAFSEIEAAFVRCGDNSRVNENLRAKAIDTITSFSSPIQQNIETTVQEAEASLTQLTELAD
jgi:hypothetical protein